MTQPFSGTPTREAKDVTLCVDLDGTLIYSDVLWESMVSLLKKNPLYLLALPFWLIRGRAHMKSEIAIRATINPSSLVYNRKFLAYLREQNALGRKLVLATAADAKLARPVAEHVGIFSTVVASEGTANMRGATKGRVLSEMFGHRQFDYAGNSVVDLAVWRDSRQAIVVNGGKGLAERAARETEVGQVFEPLRPMGGALFATLHPLRWVLNLAVFLPLIFPIQSTNDGLLKKLIFLFGAFSCVGSAADVLGELCNLEADRADAKQQSLPFASGQLPLPVGLIMIPALLLFGGCLCIPLPLSVISILAAFFLLSAFVSLRFNELRFLKAVMSAILIALRIAAGYAVARGV